MNHEWKKNVASQADLLRDHLIALSKRIHSHPELSSHEFQASEWLCNELADEGFNVKREIAGLETAFEARLMQNPEAPTIGFIAEYDALPEIGHACGHSLIAPAALGAAFVLKRLLPPEQINLVVFGTPAEETEGGKIPMLEHGVFNNVDVLLMFHAHGITTGLRPCIGRMSLAFEFFGKTAHASVFPDNGINALDAIILTYNNINALRQQTRSDVRIHGIITDGGKMVNSIPDYSRAEFFVRANDKQTMEKVAEQVKACAYGAEAATGAKLKITSPLPTYMPDIPVPSLISAFEQNLEALGLNVEHVQAPFRLGSSDFGNVSQEVPSLMGFIDITKAPTHTREFADAAGSPRGHEALIQAVKAMAMTAVDLLTVPGLLERIKNEFAKAKQVT